MSSIGYATIEIIPSMKDFRKRLSAPLSGELGAAGREGGKRYSAGLGAAVAGAGRLFAPLAAAAAGVGVVSFFKDAINGASDLNETATKVQAIFGSGTAAVNAFAAQGAKSLGQTKQQVLDASATFGTFGKAAGLSGTDLAKFSTGFAGLSTDLASFNNTSPEQAVEAIGAALRGESEPIRAYGVLLDDATLRNEALALGLIKTTKTALTPQQKVLAAQAAIYKQTGDAQGDFARTSGGLANQQRILSATFTDLKTGLGAQLLPVVVAATAGITNFVTGIQSGTGAGGAFRAVLDTVSAAVQPIGAFLTGTVVPALASFVQGMRDGSGVGGTFRAFLQGIGGALQAVTGFVQSNASSLLVLVGGVGAVVGALKLWSFATKAMAAAQVILNIALTANPLGLVLAGVVALGAGLILAYKKSETFRDIVNGAFAAVVGFVQGQLIPGVQAIVTAFRSFAATVAPIVLSVVGVVRGQLPQILTIGRQVFSTLETIVTAAFTAIRTTTTIALTAVRVVFTAGTAVVQALWSTFGAGLISTITGVLGGVLTTVRGALNVVQGVFRTFAALLTGDWSGVWAGIRQIVTGALLLVQGVVRTSLALVRGIAGAALDGIQGLFSAGWAAVTAVVRAAAGAITAAVAGLFGSVVGAVSSGLGAVRGLFSAGWSALAGIVSSAFGAVRDATSGGIGGVVRLVGSMPGRVVGALGDLGGLLFGSGARLIQGFADGVASRIAAVIAKVRSMAAQIKALLPGSPVKEGPLTSWNNGGAGKRLVGLLADGIDAGTPDAVASMRRLARQLDDPTASMAGLVGRRAVPASPRAAGGRGSADALGNRYELNLTAAPSIPTEQQLVRALSQFEAMQFAPA